MNEGLGSHGAPFEYVIEKKGKKTTRRKVLWLLTYIVWVVGIFIVGVQVKFILPLLGLIPLSLWVMIFFTWRFTKEEIKITLFSGTMIITRMFDGKNPKKLIEIKIKDIQSIEPYSPAAIKTDLTKDILYATEKEDGDGAYIITWKSKTAVIALNEKAMKILRYYNSTVF